MKIDDPEQTPIVVKGMVRAAAHWSLTDAEAAALFDVPQKAWTLMEQGKFVGQLNEDQVLRAGLVFGIFKQLRMKFNGPINARWLGLPNAGKYFGGRRPIDAIIDGGIPALSAVRSHLEAI